MIRLGSAGCDISLLSYGSFTLHGSALLVVIFFSFLMAPSHCTGTGLVTMGLYIKPLTVHTTTKPGTGQGMGLGTNGLYIHFPIPILVPGIGQCV